MTIEDVKNILNPLAFASLGTFLGALLNKIFSLKDKNNLYSIFYVFSSLALIFAFGVAIIFRLELFSNLDAGLIFWIITVLSNLLMLVVTHFYLRVKNVYRTPELDPVINNFTKKAEKDYINLLCGDISFFGETPNLMDKNFQYNCLKGESFKKINVLCFKPDYITDKVRYGKLLRDMPTTELKFYRPTKANLSLRGRITKFQGSDKLLMYTKVSDKTYQAIESDTGSYTGALYKNIWDLIWDLAESPTQEQLEEYKALSTK